MPPDSESLVLPPVNYAPDDKEKIKRHKLLWKYNTKKSINSIGMSSLGNRLVMGCEDHYIYYFDKEKELIWDYNCLSPVHSVAITESGNNIAVGTDKHVLFINAKGELIWDYKIGYPVRHITLTNSGDLIIAGGDAHKVFFFNNTGKLLKQHRTEAAVTNLRKTDDDNLFIATSEATIMFFSREPNLIWNYKTQWKIQAVTISGLGEIIVAGAMTSLYCINNRRDLLWKHTGKNVSDMIEVSRSKDYIIIGARDGFLSSYNVMGDLNWQYRTGSVKATAKKVMTKGVTAAKITHDGQYIAVGSVNKNVYFLSRNQELLYKFEAADEVEDLEMSRSGTSMAVIAGNTVYFLENIGLYPMLFNEIGGQLKEAHSHKIDITKPLAVYNAAVGSYNNGHYEAASSTLFSVKKQIIAQQKVGVKKLLSKITINMAKAEVADKDLTVIKVRLAKAKEIYKKGHFYKAVSTFHEIIENLEGMERENTPPPEPEPEESIPEVVATPMESVAPWAAEQMMPPPKEIIPKAEVTAVESTPQPVAESPMRRDGAKDELKREAKNRLNALERRLLTIGGEGFDVTMIEEISRNSKRAFERGDHKSVIDQTAEGQMEIDELLKRGEKKNALDLLSKVTEKLSEAKSKNIDTSEYEMTLAKGIKAFDRDLFRESMGIIRKLDAALDRIILKASPRYENVQNLIKRVAGEVKELKNAGMNTLELEDIIEDCWNYLNSDVDYSESMVKEVNERLIELREQHDKVKSDFKEAQERIESLEQKGYNTTRIQGIYQDALIVLYSGNLKMAMEYLDQLLIELDDLRDGKGEEEGFQPSGQDTLLMNSLKEKIAHLQDEVILNNEEVSKKEHQISELYIVIKELEEKLNEAEEANADVKECPDCGYSLPTKNKFCGECGHKFQMVCPKCETAIPEGFAFCGKCGTKMG